jgi:acetate kinase
VRRFMAIRPLDTLVFAAGIGETAPGARVCEGAYAFLALN